MHLALFVIIREFQQFGVRIAGPYMLEYFAAAAIMIALLLLIRRRKRLCVRCAARINRSADACPHCGVPHPFTFPKIEPRKQPLRKVEP
jgi:predicted amidophosphoribosyltransferase